VSSEQTPRSVANEDVIGVLSILLILYEGGNSSA
jgi:hypothetical protein